MLLFTNLASETPFYNIGFAVGCFMVVGIPTRFPKYFLNSEFFIAIKFYWFHHIQGYSEVRRIPSVTIRKISYDGAALLMLEFYVFAGVLYAVILPVVERRKMMLLGGDFIYPIASSSCK